VLFASGVAESSFKRFIAKKESLPPRKLNYFLFSDLKAEKTLLRLKFQGFTKKAFYSEII